MKIKFFLRWRDLKKIQDTILWNYLWHLVNFSSCLRFIYLGIWKKAIAFVFWFCVCMLIHCFTFNTRYKGKQVVWDTDKRLFLRQNQLCFLIDTLHFETCLCVYTYIYINLSKHKEILHLILVQSVPAYLTLISFLKESTLHSRPLYKSVVLLILIQSDTHSNNTTSLLGLKLNLWLSIVKCII